MDPKYKENLYKYLLFFKKFPNNSIRTYYEDGLSINPAIEVILYLEGFINELNKKGDILRATGVREKEYYEKFSLEKTLDLYKKEFEELSPILRKKIELLNPLNKKIFDENGLINENHLFYMLINNKLNFDSVDRLLKKYRNYKKQEMSYSFFKSLFCLENENLKKIIEGYQKGKRKESFFDFLFKYKVEFINTKEEKIKNGNFIYFSKMFFHLKNQFLNMHFPKPSTIDRINSFFSLDFLENSSRSKVFIRKTTPNVFFADTSMFNIDSNNKNLPVYKFFLQRYYYVGDEHLNSFLFLTYFPINEVKKMFSINKIKNDFLKYVRTLLKKEKINSKDINLFEEKIKKDLLKTIAKYESCNFNFYSKDLEQLKEQINIPYIGTVKFERKEIEKAVQSFINKYKQELLDSFLKEEEVNSILRNFSIYSSNEVKLLTMQDRNNVVRDFKQILLELKQRNPSIKEIDR